MSWRRFLWAVMPYVCVGVVAFGVVAYVREQQRNICGLIILMDTSYRETPPTTPTGTKIALEVARYRDKIGC